MAAAIAPASVVPRTAPPPAASARSKGAGHVGHPAGSLGRGRAAGPHRLVDDVLFRAGAAASGAATTTQLNPASAGANRRGGRRERAVVSAAPRRASGRISPIGASNGCASSVMQKKVPRIVPFGVAMRVQLVYSKRLAGLQDRLMADDGQAAHFLDVAAGVADDPVAGDQLAR